MKNRTLSSCVIFLVLSSITVSAQQATRPAEQRAPVMQAATAFDSSGTPALEATLRTTNLEGAPDAPVRNVRIVIKNVSTSFLTYVSGIVTFYDSTGVRCGEGLFKVDALTQNESAETDAPGLRIICAPTSWRVVATTLLPREAEQTLLPKVQDAVTPPMASKLVISIDGEEHPIQLGRPLVLSVGAKQKTITVRPAP